MPKALTMTAAEAKARFAESLRLVERGHTVVITRYGRPVATLASATPERPGRRGQGIASLFGKWKDGADFVARVEEVVKARTPLRDIPDFE